MDKNDVKYRHQIQDNSLLSMQEEAIMSITVSEFIEDFARKLSADQVSLFIGAGVSTEIGLPDWKMLFSDVAKALSLNIELIDDYYQLSQYYCNKYSISDLKRLVASKLQTIEIGSKTLESLLDLDFKSIWTTNFDTATGGIHHDLCGN